MYMVAPLLLSMVGTLTHRLALRVDAFQFSTQNGSRVTPSLAVNRMSAPLVCALVKSKPEPSTTCSWYPFRVVPPGLEIDPVLRYSQEELNQPSVVEGPPPREAV